MKDKHIGIVACAAAILREESEKGCYGGEERMIFNEAVRWIEKSIKKATEKLRE